MAKFQSIYAPIHDRARIIWTFLTIFPLALFLVGGPIIAEFSVVGYGFLTGAITEWSQVKAYVVGIQDSTLEFLFLIPFGLSILLTFLWVLIVENRSLATIGFTDFRWFSRYVRGFLSGVCFLLVVLGVIYYQGGYEIEAMFPIGAAANPVLPLATIAAFLVAFVIQGASEEVMFRGWWMSALAARRGKIIALIVTSTLFALAHMANVWPPTTESLIGVANIVLFGLFIGLYALKEASLWGVCGWHTAWNWLLGLGFGLEVSGQAVDATPLIVDLADAGGQPLLTGGGFGPEASLVTTCVLLVGCLYFLVRGALRSG